MHLSCICHCFIFIFKDTKRTWVKELSPSEIKSLLPDLASIHMAKWTGHDIFKRKNLKTQVILESGEVKYVKGSNMMTLRVRLMNNPIMW